MTAYGFLTTKELLNKITNLSKVERHALKLSKIIANQKRAIRFKFSPDSNKLYFKSNQSLQTEIAYQFSLLQTVSIEMNAWCPAIFRERPT